MNEQRDVVLHRMNSQQEVEEFDSPRMHVSPVFTVNKVVSDPLAKVDERLCFILGPDGKVTKTNMPRALEIQIPVQVPGLNEPTVHERGKVTYELHFVSCSATVSPRVRRALARLHGRRRARRVHKFIKWAAYVYVVKGKAMNGEECDFVLEAAGIADSIRHIHFIAYRADSLARNQAEELARRKRISKQTEVAREHFNLLRSIADGQGDVRKTFAVRACIEAGLIDYGWDDFTGKHLAGLTPAGEAELSWVRAERA